jgi:hypothetical protein
VRAQTLCLSLQYSVLMIAAAAALVAGPIGCGSPEGEVAGQEPMPELEPAAPPADVQPCSLGSTERDADGEVVRSGTSIPAQLTRERCITRCATAWQRLLGNKPQGHLFIAKCWFGDEKLESYAGVGRGIALAASEPSDALAGESSPAPEAPASPMDAHARARELARELPFNTYQERGRILDELEALGKPAVPVLVAELRSQDAAVREGAADTLGKIASLRAVDGLVAAFPDASSRVRGSVVEALGAIGDPRAVPHLIGMLDDENGAVANDAMDALGEIGDPRALPELRRVHAQERSSRGATGHAIRKIERAEMVSR